MTLRVVPGVVEAHNATTRLILPTSSQPVWPPFQRVGETLATVTRQFPAHAHQAQEVLTYVVEGFASYQQEAQAPEPLLAGSARLLTSPAKSTHRISPAIGSPIRWFNLVVGLAPSAAKEVRVQGSEPFQAERGPEGASIRQLVGPNSQLTSAAGLEVMDLEFVANGTSFQRVGHKRRAVLYVLAGRGAIDSQNVEVGEGVLVENAAGIGIQGSPGFRVVLSTVPNPPGTP